MSAVRHVAEAFSVSLSRQRTRQTVHGQPWAKEVGEGAENLRGSPEETSRYISRYGEDRINLTIHGTASSKLVLNCIAASFITVFLQWGSTGAAIIIAYK